MKKAFHICFFVIFLLFIKCSLFEDKADDENDL
jgi:hypothetical protein